MARSHAGEVSQGVGWIFQLGHIGSRCKNRDLSAVDTAAPRLDSYQRFSRCDRGDAKVVLVTRSRSYSLDIDLCTGRRGQGYAVGPRVTSGCMNGDRVPHAHSWRCWPSSRLRPSARRRQNHAQERSSGRSCTSRSDVEASIRRYYRLKIH